jgi:hypothetical protein
MNCFGSWFSQLTLQMKTPDPSELEGITHDHMPLPMAFSDGK